MNFLCYSKYCGFVKKYVIYAVYALRSENRTKVTSRRSGGNVEGFTFQAHSL